MPPMDTARTYQTVWGEECRQAMCLIRKFLQVPDAGERARVIADIMIDRGLAALFQAPNNRTRLYASIGILRFAEFRMLRFPALKEAIVASFADNPPDSVRQRIEALEVAMWTRSGQH